MIFVHLLLVSYILATAADLDKCPGMTFTVAESQLSKTYNSIYTEVAKTLPKSYADIEVALFRPLGIYVRARKITAEFGIESKPININVNAGSLVLNNEKDFLLGNFRADCAWTLFWIEFVTGTINLAGGIDNSVLTQTFSTEFINTTMSANTRLSVKSIDVSIFKDVIGRNIIKKLNDAFGSSVLRTFKENMDAYTKYFHDWATKPVFEDENLPVIIHNDFMKLVKERKNINYCFKTWIGIKERAYAKAVHRLEDQYPMATENLGQACLTDSVLLALPEVMAKARYYLSKIEAKVLGLDNHVRDLIPIVAKIQEVFNASEEVDIGCRMNSELDITVLNLKTENGMPYVQVPLSCNFGGKTSGYNILNINTIARAKLDVVKNYGGINIQFTNSTLYSFNYQGVVGPVTDFMLIQAIAHKIAGLLNGKNLFETDLKIGMGFDDLVKRDIIRNNHQNCFTFSAQTH